MIWRIASFLMMTMSAATGKAISWVRGQFSLQAYLSHWPSCCDLQPGINWFQLQCGLLKYQHLFTCKTTHLSYIGHHTASSDWSGLKLNHSLLEVKCSMQFLLVWLYINYCFPLIPFKFIFLLSDFPYLNFFCVIFFLRCVFWGDFS